MTNQAIVAENRLTTRRCSKDMSFGTEIESDGRISFHLWAPEAKNVQLHLLGNSQHTTDDLKRDLKLRLSPTSSGWHLLTTADAQPGMDYKFIIDGELAVPDPASRYQPFDALGASRIVDPRHSTGPTLIGKAGRGLKR